MARPRTFSWNPKPPPISKSPNLISAAGEAWLPIANLKDTAKLRGVPLKLTLSTGDSGIEQTLVIT